MRLLILLLMVPCLASTTPTQKCFDDAAARYITCRPIHGRPAACDCRHRYPCYIKMIITKKLTASGAPHGTSIANSVQYLINDTFQGPTIITMQNGIVVTDVSRYERRYLHTFPWNASTQCCLD